MFATGHIDIRMGLKIEKGLGKETIIVIKLYKTLVYS